MKIRILVVDDHDVVRKGVAAMLGGHPGWEVCAEARNGREAVASAARLKPDIVIMDISMPDMNGLEATRQIVGDNPGTEVLVLTMHDSDLLVRQVLASGARGYILKSDAGSDLIDAVEAVSRRKRYFSRSVGDAIVRGYLDHPGPESGGQAAPEPLTAREREIVQLVAEGKSSKEISAILNITAKTVETHRSKIMTKLGIHSLPELVRYAIRNHIIEC
jgi:DNA-binding NarL/FixJ family response regulator